MPPSGTTGVPWPTIVAAAGGILSVVGTALFLLVRMLMKAQQRNTEQALAAVRAEVLHSLQEFQAVTLQKFEKLTADVIELDKRLGRYFDAHEKLRDKWDEFLREYLKIDSTRGQKVDALFRIVDQMQETLREIRPALNTKVEEMLTHALAELKLYVRDLMEEERDG